MTFRKSDEESKEDFQRNGISLTTATVRVDNHHIHYAKTGNDTLPTLFFLHGTPGSWDAFAEYMQDEELLRKFRMISIDRPGFGGSDFGTALHLDKQSELISPLFQQFRNGKPMFIAGHSMGGPMVIKLAADNPEIFSALVIISGSLDPDEQTHEKWRRILFKTPLNYFVPGALRPSNEELWFLKDDLVELEKDFSKIHCPVYFVHGAKDTWVPPKNVDYGRKMLVHANSVQVKIIPDANHFIPWTKFTEIKDLLLKLY
jgi:pimeloyl-ACP methyl ester carboxylesterase